MARLNYHHLHYFWQVATEGNLTRAARNLHVSQSALSSQIRALEESAGMKLFDRAGRQLTLTDAGRQVLAFANDIFSRGEELEAWLRRGGEPGGRLLRIGMLSTLSRNFVDRFVAPLLQDPEARFVLEAGSLESLLERLSRHQLDIALTNGDVRGSDEQLWEARLLARETASVLGPPGMPEREFPDDYGDARWIVPTRDTEVRRSFEAYCSAHGFEPRIQAEANDMAMLRLLARDSGAYAVLPRIVVRDELRQGTLVEYRELPEVHENFYAISIRRKHPPEALRTLHGAFAATD